MYFAKVQNGETMSKPATREPSDLQWLCDWVASQCNDEWEHGHAFSLGMYDNPGWELRICIQDTPLDGLPFVPRSEGEYAVDEWLDCRVEDGFFKCDGGITRLPEMVRIFRAWVEGVAATRA
jgi:hypothetical protein